MKKAVIFIGILVLAVVVALSVMTDRYTDSYDYKSKGFREGYIINGVRCFGLNYDQAVSKITSEWNARDILVVGAMDEPLATIKSQDCTYDIKKQVERVKKDHKLLGALNYYFNVPISIRMPMTITSCGEEFTESIKNLGFLSRGNAKATADAYVDLEDPDFRIVKEVYGNKPDEEKFLKDITRTLELGETKFVFRDEDYIAIPKVKSTDPKLLAYQQYCRSHFNQKITYDLGIDSYTITRQELIGFYEEGDAGKINEDAVRKFVEKIAERYDNADRERTFKSLTGRSITLKNTHYGWQVDQDGETEQLEEDIKSHEDVSREPVWASKGYGSYSIDVGNTYVDIDISKQKLIYFRNGKNVFSTDVVTGCRNNGTVTPTGLFSVLNKARNVTLKGRNSNGSQYSSFVNYWMAFLGSSYGMHDATWRSQFGGDIWITSGSHGCVNVPPSKMPRLYELVDYNTPVVIYE